MLHPSSSDKYVFVLEGQAVSYLQDSFEQGPIIDDNGQRLFTEATVARFNGLKVEIFANEHL